MSEKFLPQELIRKKRDGLSLSHSEIGFLVKGISDESLTDAQLGALCYGNISLWNEHGRACQFNATHDAFR